MATLMSYFAPPIAGEWGDEAEDNTDGVPVLRTTNFTADGRLSYDDLTYRSIDTEKKENKILQPGDIIIEKSGGTPKKPVGRCVYFDRDDDYDYFCSNFTAILRANTEDVNTKYLWYLLQEHYKTRQCLKYQYKTNGIANLDIKDYLSHKEVELPPREVQDKRVEAMDYSQYLLDLHQELLEIMDNAVKSRFIEMFGDPVMNPMGWEVKKLKDLSLKISDGVHAKPNYTEDGKPFISVVNITTGHIDFSNCKFVSQEDYEKMIKSTHPEKGDVLYTKVGATYGIPAYVDTDEDFCLYVSVCLIKPKHELVNARFLTESMRLPYIKHQADRRIRGIGVPDLHLNQIREFDLVCPPLDLQERYMEFVDLVDKSKLTIQKSMDNLQELRDSLLQEYFG